MTTASGERAPLINLPNLLTVSRIAATPVFLAMLFADAWYWRAGAVLVFGAASLTDLYDGRLARARDSVTEFGRFMDPLADKILVTSALVAFVVSRVVNAWIVVPIVVRDLVITAMRMHGLYQGRMMETSRLAKWKTSVQLVAVIVVLALVSLLEVAAHYRWQGVLDGLTWMPLVGNALMAAVLVLTLLSGFHYFFRTGSA